MKNQVDRGQPTRPVDRWPRKALQPTISAMRILIHGINYAPELTGIGKYTGEMAEKLASEGHDVTVITAPPYYPEWKVHSAYKKKGWYVEHSNGVKIYRVPLYVPAKVSSIKRIVHEFSFLSASVPVWFGFLFKKKFDVVLSIAPPFHLGVLPLLYGKIRRSPVISHIQDLQIDAAQKLGMIRNNRLLKLMFSLERFILKHSANVTTISNGMMRNILKKGIENDKTAVVPNWVDTEHIKPTPVQDSLRHKFNIPLNHKVVMYSGNLGEKQGLEVIIEVAEMLKLRSDVHFLIVGTGGMKDALVRMAEEKELQNIHFHPLQPYEQLNALLATADAHLVLQRASAADLVMPSKLGGILAAGGCAIVTASPGTYLHDIVDTHQMGIIAKPESANALLKAIEESIDGEGVDVYKTNARFFAERNLAKGHILGHLESHLEWMAVRDDKKVRVPRYTISHA